MKIYVQKGTYKRIFIAVLFVIVKNWKQYQRPINKKMDKQIMVYLNGVLLKKNVLDTCYKIDESWKYVE